VSGLGRVIVGFRPNRRRESYYEDHGVPLVTIRACAAACGYPVLVLPGGLATMHEKDPEVVCEECAALYKVEFERAAL
jgi:hypothetical protein